MSDSVAARRSVRKQLEFLFSGLGTGQCHAAMRSVLLLLLPLCSFSSCYGDLKEEENYQVIENALISLVGKVETKDADPELDMTAVR